MTCPPQIGPRCGNAFQTDHWGLVTWPNRPSPFIVRLQAHYRERVGAGVVASVRKEKARHGLPGFPQGAVNFGVAVRSFGYLTSDCNPTSFPLRAEPIPAKRIFSTPRQPTRPAIKMLKVFHPLSKGFSRPWDSPTSAAPVRNLLPT